MFHCSLRFIFYHNLENIELRLQRSRENREKKTVYKYRNIKNESKISRYFASHYFLAHSLEKDSFCDRSPQT